MGPGVVVGETPDFGFGVLALCVLKRPTASDRAHAIFCTLHTHQGGSFPGATHGHNMVSSLHIHDVIQGTMATTASTPSRIFDGAANPEVFGICGAAVGNLQTDAANDGVEDELVLTSLNGDLLVYQLQGSRGSVDLGPLLHWSVHDGSLGANNAILIHEPTSNDPQLTLFVASSMGIFNFRPHPLLQQPN